MLFASEKLSSLARSETTRSLGRWWIVGVIFLGWSTGVLYLLVSFARMPLTIASLITAEVGTILRFFVNARWVFGHRRPTRLRFWQYHVANAGGFAIWWSVCNLLPLFGVHFLFASLAATACSVGLSMLTNFLWIWRRHYRGSGHESASAKVRAQ
jgi:putative flippase GtrA